MFDEILLEFRKELEKYVYGSVNIEIKIDEAFIRVHIDRGSHHFVDAISFEEMFKVSKTVLAKVIIEEYKARILSDYIRTGG